MVKDIRKQGLKALKYLQDIDKDDVLEAIGLDSAAAHGPARSDDRNLRAGVPGRRRIVSRSLQERRGLPQRARDRMRRKADELGVNQDVMSRSQIRSRSPGAAATQAPCLSEIIRQFAAPGAAQTGLGPASLRR